MAEEEISWDDAINTSGFVKLEQDEQKKLVLTNWKNVKVEKFGGKKAEFQADVLEEDDKKVEKQFTTVSNRLKMKLRAILEGKNKDDKVKVSILRVGNKYSTNYSCKELKD